MTDPTERDILDFEAMMHEGGDEGEAAYYAALDVEQEREHTELLTWEAEQAAHFARIERGVCPFCESRAITETGTGGAGSVQANGAEVDVCWTDYRCDECGGEWAME